MIQKSGFVISVLLLAFLSQCSDGYPNFATVPPRQDERIPLEDVNKDLEAMTLENALQKKIGTEALGANFRSKG